MSDNKKTRNRTTSTAANNQSGTIYGKYGNWEKNQGLIFEMERSKVEFNLDKRVTDALSEYEKYLQEVYERSPNKHGVVEAILLDSLDNHSNFQKWRTEQGKNRTAKTKSNLDSGEQEGDLLETDEDFEAVNKLGASAAVK